LRGSEELAREKRHQIPIKDTDREKWKAIFVQHPEFFKMYSLENEQRVALRWRFAQSINHDPKIDKIVPAKEIKKMRESDRYARFTRRPLTSEEIGVLIKTAIDLHSRVIEQATASRWYIPIISAVLSAVGAFVGAIFGKGH